jgi:hypothetical protein
MGREEPATQTTRKKIKLEIKKKLTTADKFSSFGDLFMYVANVDHHEFQMSENTSISA